jgi:hypothetical protein
VSSLSKVTRLRTTAYGGPLARKLGIKPSSTLALRGAPDGFDGVLGELPDGVFIKRRAVAPLDVIVAFFVRRGELERRFERLAAAVFPDGGLWIAWPKRASGVPTDLTEDVTRAVGLAHGLVDNKVCAIDETWSGLRLVHRLENRR